MLRLNDLNTAVDKVHSYFERWEEQHDFVTKSKKVSRSDCLLQEARLAAHEWMANLVQHADFDGRSPLIAVDVQQKGNAIRCIIVDNSDGFDMENELEQAFKKNSATVLPDRGMGLLMLHTCASTLSYKPGEKGHQRLDFLITPSKRHVTSARKQSYSEAA